VLGNTTIIAVSLITDEVALIAELLAAEIPKRLHPSPHRWACPE